MATKKPIATSADLIAAARKKAQEGRENYKHKPGPDELFTTQEIADAAPFYFALRDFIHQLKKARQDAGLTLADISAKTGIAVESLSRLETGSQTNPTWKTLGTFAAAVGRRPCITTAPLSNTDEERFDAEELFSSMNRISDHAFGFPTTQFSERMRRLLETIEIPQSIWLAPEKGGFGFPGFRVYELFAKSNLRRSLIEWDDCRVAILAADSIGYTDVVGMTEVSEGKGIVISFAFRVFSDLCETPISELLPLNILEKFTDRFGFMMSSGVEQRKFFLKQEIKRSDILMPVQFNNATFKIDDTVLLQIENRGAPVIMGTSLRIGDDRTIRLAVAFSVDAIAYKGWMESHKVC